MGSQGATIAIPLIKVIEQAPYARDALYGVARLKEGSEAQIPTPTIDRPVAASGRGDDDISGGHGLDRVFFASPDERSEKLPDDYVVPLNDEENKPASYIVDRTSRDSHSDEQALVGLVEGNGAPERVYIEAEAGYDAKVLSDENETIRNEVSVAAIRQLQEDYFHAYNHLGVVVPLRRGVFKQAFENMPEYKYKGRERATEYNRYVPGSGKITF